MLKSDILYICQSKEKWSRNGLSPELYSCWHAYKWPHKTSRQN